MEVEELCFRIQIQTRLFQNFIWPTCSQSGQYVSLLAVHIPHVTFVLSIIRRCFKLKKVYCLPLACLTLSITNSIIRNQNQRFRSTSQTLLEKCGAWVSETILAYPLTFTYIHSLKYLWTRQIFPFSCWRKFEKLTFSWTHYCSYWKYHLKPVNQTHGYKKINAIYWMEV